MPINEEYIFTYGDYLTILDLDGLYSVAEKDIEYKLGVEQELENSEKDDNDVNQGLEDQKEIHQKHDKSFKEALSSREEMSFFLREFVGIEVDIEELQEYRSEFITKRYGRRQSDIVYRNTKKEIYYIIEHQSKKDKSMPYRIMEYCTELMRDVIKNSNSEFYPIIIPIVLYTGDGKWDVETNFAERQKYYEGTYEEYKIDIKYTVVDVNKIKDMELLEKQDYLANIMLMEKCKMIETKMEMLVKIRDKAKNEKQREEITDYFINIYGQTLEPEKRKEFYKKFRGSDVNMTAMYESIIREKEENIKKGRAEGMAKGKAEVARNLLKLKLPIQQIIEATGLSKKEVEKLSESMV